MTDQLIVLQGLEGNEATHFVPLQLMLEPYVVHFQIMWWGIFVITLVVVVTRHIVLPLVKKWS